MSSIDFRICRNCAYKATGYKFAAYVVGLDPAECPECKKVGVFEQATPEECRIVLQTGADGCMS